MAINELVYNNHTFSRIRSAKARFSESVSLSSLPVDTLTVTVVEGDAGIPAPSPVLPLAATHLLSSGMALITAPQPIDRPTVGPYTRSLNEYSYGEVVSFYHSGKRICKFYLESIKQVGKWDWTFSCISPVGMLITSDHYGGIYTGQKAGDVIANIIGGIVPYTIDSKLAEAEVYGWLPKATRRNNLRDVLFASNAAVEYNSNGDLHFYQYGKQPEPKTLQASAFYLGGSVNNGTPATEAIVIEHNFVARTVDETVTLYDGEASGTSIVTPMGKTVTGVLVEFKEPIHDLKITGASILESNPNYAVISSTGYANLTGQRYTHTERQAVQKSEVKSSPNVVQSGQCTLVNIRNSKVTSERVIAFYGYAHRVAVDLLYHGEKCGEYVSFVDPYGNGRVGYIESLELVFSKEIKASASIVCGFIPPFDIPLKLKSETFTSNTTWTVPEGVTQVRVVCIGGGSAGYSGYNGSTGGPGVTYQGSNERTYNGSVYRTAWKGITAGTAGAPGNGGEPGNGGKIFSGTMDVTPGQKISVTIGSGGTGRSGNHVAGNDGGATTFGSFSSANGAVSPSGYVEEITGKTYANRGASSGVAGKKGGSSTKNTSVVAQCTAGETLSYGGSTYSPGVYNGTNVPLGSQSSSGYYTYSVTQGLGGGPAAGRNGGNQSGGNGGAGATPVAPAASTNPGQGGSGGHGGGGGGAPGGQETYWGEGKDVNPPTIYYPSNMSYGAGGTGGPGGNGAPGICFIYYYVPEEV